jgi:hypothetical protein
MIRVRESLSKKLTTMNLIVRATALLLAFSAFFVYDVIALRSNLKTSTSLQAQLLGENVIMRGMTGIDLEIKVRWLLPGCKIFLSQVKRRPGTCWTKLDSKAIDSRFWPSPPSGNGAIPTHSLGSGVRSRAVRPKLAFLGLAFHPPSDILRAVPAYNSPFVAFNKRLWFRFGDYAQINCRLPIFTS